MLRLNFNEFKQLKLKGTFNKKYKSFTYLNEALVLSVETSTIEEIKSDITYLFTLAFNNYYIQCRTYEELKEILNEFKDKFNLSKSKLAILYVYDLSYIFQFIKYHFDWYEVFSVQVNEPIKARTEAFEFRDLKALSNLKLSRLSEVCANKVNIPVIDENAVRTPETALNEELDYSAAKAELMLNYIKEQLSIYNNNITKMPLTATGKVRNLVRSNCLRVNGKVNKDYASLIKRLNITLNEYENFLEPAYKGGYCSVNSLYQNEILHDLTSYDIISSYPAAMLRFKYPMTEARYIKLEKPEDLEKLNKYNRCYIITFKALNIKSKYCFDLLTPLNITLKGKYKIINGKIREAEEAIITLTNVDFKLFKECYSYSKILYAEALYYGSDYLPKELVASIIDLYKNKQAYKLSNNTTLYNFHKQNLDSCYGMICQKPYKPIIKYENGKFREDTNIAKSEILTKYNNNFNRFLYFAWGVFITSYARYRLWEVIKHINGDLIYTDTDSVKILNAYKYKEFISEQNRINRLELQQALKVNNFTLEDVKAPEGYIGDWLYEEDYLKAKFIAPKTYLTQNSEGLNITVSGVDKVKGLEYVKSLKGDPFEFIVEGFKFNSTATGKTERVILDKPLKAAVIDLNGLKTQVSELSSIYSHKVEYTVGDIDDFIDFVKGARQNHYGGII